MMRLLWMRAILFYLSNGSQASIIMSPVTRIRPSKCIGKEHQAHHVHFHHPVKFITYFICSLINCIFAHKGVFTSISHIINFADRKRSHQVERTIDLSTSIKLYRNFLFPSQLSWFFFIRYDFTCIKTVDGNMVTEPIKFLLLFIPLKLGQDSMLNRREALHFSIDLDVSL